MPFEPITAPNLSAAAAGQIRDLIARDVLQPGDQLPGERDLAHRMGISRTSLRAALQTLVTEQLLVARHGAGLFVSDEIGAPISAPLLRLIETRDEAVFDYLGFRSILEGESAALAAEHATLAEKDRISALHTALAEAHGAGDTETASALDTAFHMAIVEASGNVVSIQVARSLHALLQETVRRNNALEYDSPGVAEAIVAQHADIDTGIRTGRPDAARAAMKAHLAYFEGLIRREADIEKRHAIVEKRAAWARDTGRSR